MDGLRGEDSIAELCRREGISQGIYYKWSKDFMEAGKKRLAGDTARAANTDEVKELRREAKDLKEVVAEQTLELRLLKKASEGTDPAPNSLYLKAALINLAVLVPAPWQWAARYIPERSVCPKAHPPWLSCQE